MTRFESLFSEIRDRKHQCTVYRQDDDPDLEARFATRNVSIDYRPLPAGGPEAFLVFRKNGEFAGTIGLQQLDRLLEPPIVRPGEHDHLSEGYGALFELLDNTVFTTMDRRQLLVISREIEDRAFRTGNGTLHASFQTNSAFESQLGVYRQLATTGLDIHIHAMADRTLPEISGIRYHRYPVDTLGGYWILAFDGGPNATHACGLLARQQTETYDGFWTDDTGIVAKIISELTET